MGIHQPGATRMKPKLSLYPRPLRNLNRSLQQLVAGRLWLKVMLAMAAGIAAGMLLGPSTGLVGPDNATVIGNWLAFPGHLFLILVQMIVVPLVFASIIRGLASTDDINQLRRLGLAVVAFFVVTTAVSISTSILLARVVNPGQFIDTSLVQALEITDIPAAGAGPRTPDLAQLSDTVISLFPSNPLGPMVDNQMLEVVIFSVIFGVALILTPPERARPLLDFLGSLQEVCMTIVRGAMLLAPVAVFGLMTQLATRVGLEALLGMAVYVLTVIGGLLILLCLFLLLVAVVARKSPLRFLAAARELLLLAFSTSSSAAVMPLSIKTAEDRLGVRPSIAEFVIPIGATINMNGTALYQGVATIFLAQVFGIDLSFSELSLLVVVAVGASIGSPATPGVGIVILAMVLDTVGIPSAGIALLMGVDRILDMARTSLNVAGDLVTCLVMDRWIGGPSSHAEEISVQQGLKARRENTAEDVIIAPDPPG